MQGYPWIYVPLAVLGVRFTSGNKETPTRMRAADWFKIANSRDGTQVAFNFSNCPSLPTVGTDSKRALMQGFRDRGTYQFRCEKVP